MTAVKETSGTSRSVSPSGTVTVYWILNSTAVDRLACGVLTMVPALTTRLPPWATMTVSAWLWNLVVGLERVNVQYVVLFVLDE